MRGAAAHLLLALALAALVALVQRALSPYAVTLLSLVLMQVALAVSLQVTNGLTGLFSLGHPAFMTVGAYVSAILTYPVRRKGFMMPDLPPVLAESEWALVPAVLVAALAAALLALVVGLSVLRLKGHYLAVATLGLIIVVRTLVNNLDGYTRGGLGLSGVPRLTDPWTVYAFVVLVWYLCWRIKHSSYGRAMMAMRENELAARSTGVDVLALQLFAFVFGAAVAGAAGALTVHLVSVVTPGAYGIPLAFTLVVMVVIGGQGSLTGAALAAVLVALASEALRPLEESLELYGLSQALVAVALLLMLRFRPQGLFGSREPGLLVGGSNLGGSSSACPSPARTTPRAVSAGTAPSTPDAPRS